MICPNCKSEITPGNLFCLNCAQAKADEEIERVSLLRFQTGTYALGLTGSHHLVPNGANVLTLCRERRFKKPSTIRFYLWNLTNEPKKKLCEKCKAKAMQMVEAKA